MPRVESLDNAGTPTGVIQFITPEHWGRIQRHSKPMFRLVDEEDTPMVSRAVPVPTKGLEEGDTIIKFDPRQYRVKEAIPIVNKIGTEGNKEEAIKVLEEALEIELNRPTLRSTLLDAIEKRINHIKNG